jgi:DNA-directed RNA polymerase beta' subunit
MGYHPCRVKQRKVEVLLAPSHSLIAAKRGKRGGQTAKPLVTKLKSKKGLFRYHLMGKRVNFSSRSVITPAVISPRDIVVPLWIAMKLTRSEVVTEHNIQEMRQRVLNGPSKLFGAKTVTTDKGKSVSLDKCDRSKIDLRYGWKVERFMKNGDTILFNRQPSLWRKSIMAHRAWILEEAPNRKTFGLDLSCTTAYNAGFGTLRLTTLSLLSSSRSSLLFLF